MLTTLELLGERLLSLLVPESAASAASTSGCTFVRCGFCRGRPQSYIVCGGQVTCLDPC
jgi:hypothetical protein